MNQEDTTPPGGATGPRRRAGLEPVRGDARPRPQAAVTAATAALP